MIAGLVLAGGRASRLGGGDKTLLAFGHGTLLDAVLATLMPQVDITAISANGCAARFARFGLPVLPDRRANAGPLAGLESGLRWAAACRADALLTVPGDTPFLPHQLAARLAPAPAWAASQGALHPLVALWPVAADLSAWLDSGGSLKVRAFGAALGMRQVDFAETPDPFVNVNTPDDLRLARKAIRD